MKDEIENLKSRLATAEDALAGMRSVIVTCGNTIGFLSLTIANQVRRDNPAARAEANQSACKAIDAISTALSTPASQDGETKGGRKHLVMTAGYWFEGSRKSQREGKSGEAVMCMENAYNHVENALYAANAHIAEVERENRNLNETVARLTSELGKAESQATAQHDAALARVKELEDDGKLLDWIWEFIKENGLLSIQRWDHDGRRFLGRTLLVRTFAERGGENETLRAAIRTAMTETGGEADKQIAESREAVDALGGISNLRLKPKTGGGE